MSVAQSIPGRVASGARRVAAERFIPCLAIAAGVIAGPLAGRANSQIACQYEIVATIQGPECGPIGPRGLIPAAMSPNGLFVTGYHDRCDGIDYDAFLWIGPPPGIRITIPRPPGIIGARGVDVNNNGVVTGNCRFTEGGNDRGFIWKYATAQWVTLEPPQSQMWIVPTAINSAGTMVGYRSIRNDIVPREAFIWNEATGFQGLGVMIGPSSGAYDISENGIVVGWTGSHNGHPFYNGARGFVYQQGTTTILDPVPGGVSSVAKDVNGAAQVIVQGKTQSSPVILYSTFVYSNGTMTPVPVPNGFDWAAVYGLTDSELFVGDCGHFRSNESPACVTQGGRSLVLQGNITPPAVDFTHTNYAADATLNGSILLVGRTLQNLPVGFLLVPMPVMRGDTNCDEHVNIDDLLSVINSWGRCASCPADFDHSDVVDIDDLLTVISEWLP